MQMVTATSNWGTIWSLLGPTTLVSHSSLSFSLPPVAVPRRVCGMSWVGSCFRFFLFSHSWLTPDLCTSPRQHLLCFSSPANQVLFQFSHFLFAFSEFCLEVHHKLFAFRALQISVVGMTCHFGYIDLQLVFCKQCTKIFSVWLACITLWPMMN